MKFSRSSLILGLILAVPQFGCDTDQQSQIRPGAEKVISKEHPRLLGSKEDLQRLAKMRPEAYTRVVEAAREMKPGDPGVMDDHMKMVSMALVCAIEDDSEIGRSAIKRAMAYIQAPIRVGHETFGHDLARCAIVYDLCWPYWSEEERLAFHTYMNRTVDANVDSEAHVFHNGWYGYKHWGIGLACYATWYENPRAPEILAETEDDYMRRAAPALALSGDGGGFAEGYYINYWLYEWLFFCEVARQVEGRDYYLSAPGFYGNRAVAGMFEAYPWLSERNSRRPIPMGDSGGQKLRRERDKALSARRILVNRFRDDPSHQAVHSFNETTPVCSIPGNAYKDFLWRDESVTKGDLENFRLSHFSQGAGYIYARSSWQDDATHFFFKCGDRFTAHQHLDNGHFLISKYDELAGDGGQYYYFGGKHDANYLLRTIAHNSILVRDPQETWHNIRAYQGPLGNDGGQHHNWPHHNGAVADAEAWQRDSKLYDIADILAFEDRGEYIYLAGDLTRSYLQEKLDSFTRQIVYIRPGTFVIFDRVVATSPSYLKTWQLQTVKPAERMGQLLKTTNDKGGSLFLQTLLPTEVKIILNTGDDLYRYDGEDYAPEEIRGPAPECRIAVSPRQPAETDFFLTVLTATESSADRPVMATCDKSEDHVTVRMKDDLIEFQTERLGGRVEISGIKRELTGQVLAGDQTPTGLEPGNQSQIAGVMRHNASN